MLTPYRAQLGALRAALRGAGAREEDMRAIDIQTVDGYQVGLGFRGSGLLVLRCAAYVC